MTNIEQLLAENPILIYLGVILALIVYAITRYLETVEERDMEVPEPTTLDEIVRPKVEAKMNHRGKEPSVDTLLKFGRDPAGSVNRFFETSMPKELLNPDPNQQSNSSDDDAQENTEVVRVIEVGAASTIDELLQTLKEMFGMAEEGSDSMYYVFKKEAFLDHPGDDMVIDPDVLSYEYAGMEVQATAPTRNIVNQAVQTETTEKLMSAIPNYTEKVDYLFPLHSQQITKVREEGEARGDGADF